MFSPNFIGFFTLFICIWVGGYTLECRFKGYDFSPLDGAPWIVETVNGSSRVTYKLSVCKALSNGGHIEAPCQHQTSVCRHDGGDQYLSIGNFTTPLNITENEQQKELWLTLNGAPCAGSPTRFTSTIINFKCGKTLGSPRLLDRYACDTYFEWHTSVACRDPPTVSEVKCHVYDSDGYKRDLTPLIKQDGGTLVNSAGERDFFINVCREITPSGATQKCPGGEAACELTKTSYKGLGKPVGPVTITRDNKLYLLYRGDTTPAGCDSPPTTSITFVCPRRGGGREPLLTSDLGCHYDIEWITEYACPEHQLTSNTCTLTQAQHGIEFDLTPLHKERNSEHPYKVTVREGDDTYDYFLNVCGDLDIPCSSATTNVTGCQTKGSVAKVLGRLEKQKLRYSDGELTLTYKGGETCSSHFKREVVINFHCDRNAAADGMGWPVFNHEDSCTYLFDWDTKFACLQHALPTQCHVRHDNHRFDLSSLIKEGQSNWEVLRSSHIDGDTDDDRYFMNVCHDILQVGVASQCPSSAAVCLRDKAGHYVNLGEYVSGPSYVASSRSLQLHYTNGSQCAEGKLHESIVTLKCKPGDLESGPDLVLKSHDGCRHEFEWATAAACALSTQYGSKCTVTDPDAGYSIDLGRLQRTGESAFYNVTDGEYTYYINVCGAAKGSPCDAEGKEDSAVCQVSVSDPTQVVSAGKASAALSYYNGMVNLTYIGGDPYHSKTPHLRSAQIAFLCQPGAGRGHPEFVYEANFTYSFRWETAYVCPEAPVECAVTDPKSGQQYDLSSLARASSAGNWVTSESGTGRRFYINVCRPVNPLPASGLECDPASAACSTNTDTPSQVEAVEMSNLGQATSGPTIEGEGQLLLTYGNGAECTKSDGTKTTYTTKIHLRCQRGQLNQAPKLLNTEDCAYIFLWETATACPLGGPDVPSGATTPAPTSHGETVKPLDCAVKDPNSDFIFDLKALRKTDSQVAYTVGNLKVNICRPVRVAGCNAESNQEAGVCNGTNYVASVNSTLKISDNGRLSLVYQGPRLDDGQKKEVIILFECNKEAIQGPLRVTHLSVESIEITMQTALACAPEPVDCVITDAQGHEYDLSPLSRSTDNWRVVDPRPEHNDLTYYINVCHTLNTVTGTNCPGGPIGGCQLTSDSKAYNLGYVQSKPIAGRDGALSIRYLGGDICHKGTPQESRRSTRIIFECSDTQSAPVMQSETEDCEYIFTWETPSACPLKSVTGSACQVTDPLYHYTFDLSHLRKVGNHDYSVTAGEFTYLLNVCGPLNAGPGTCAGGEIGACQTKDKVDGGLTTISAGKANQKLSYNDGELTLTYTEGRGPCHGKYNRKTIISFVCDHKTVGTGGPSFINETSDCTYLFEWRTSLACTNFRLVDCNIRDAKGQEYDLSPLTLTNDNYVYSRANRRYLINVCTTLVHKKGVTCPPNSAACYIDSEETETAKKYVKLGEVTGRLLAFDEYNNIQLTYTRGQNCSRPQNRQHQTIITFVCKEDAMASSPTLVYAEDDCIFNFVWETRVACPVSDSTPTSNNCTVKNPVTGYLYNFAGLGKPDGYLTRDAHGHELLINICGPLSNSGCTGNPASCQKEVGGERTWNAGLPNGEVHFIDGDIFLNYSLGDICHHNNLTRNTIINFVCGKSGTGNGMPVFVDEDDDCNYFVSWHTELACERQVRCEVSDDLGHLIDLSPLVRGSGSHLVMATDYPDATYYINVCRPLNPISGALCPPQAAACKVKGGEKPTSLGRVKGALVFDEYSRNVYIVYDHGTPCDKNNGKTNSSSRINFVCKPGTEQGTPILEMVTSDCTHMFEWETNVVCTGNDMPKVTKQCRFTVNSLKYTYDLTPLSKNSGNGYKISSQRGTYYINICAPVVDDVAKSAGCGSASVCFVDEQSHVMSFGTPATQKYVMEGNALKLSYTDGNACGSGKAASYFLFECNRDVQGLGQPEIFSQSSDGCVVVFKWQTVLACHPVAADCSLAHKGTVYNLNLLSRQTGYWNVTDGHGNTFWLNLCQGLRGAVNSVDCPPSAAACRRDSLGQVDTLGLVQTQHITMSDDEKTIVVEYSQGSNACAQRRKRRDDRASIKMYLTCGTMLGHPVYIPRKGDKDSCAFEFNWKSPAACKDSRVPATEANGLLVDPRSGGVIDLTKFKTAEDYRVKSEDGKMEFLINFDHPVKHKSTLCDMSAVCQRTRTSSSSSIETSIGGFTARRFFIEDRVVEAEFQSNTSCQTDVTKKATTVIYFHCIESANKNTTPVFRTKTQSCVYLFDWYTPDICVQQMIHRPTTHTVDTSVIAAHANTVGVVIGVLITLVVLVTLVVIFSKAERRQTFRRGVRRILHRRHGGSLVKYSTLSSLDEDESLIPDNTPGTPGSATLADLQTRLPTFDDDSDEDMIL